MMVADKLHLLEKTMAAFYQPQLAEQLNQSVLYSLQAGGKRIRPLLLLTILEAFGVELLPAHYQVAACVELIHTGSLIHDDLPAMDNDDYRRGCLTNHKVYGETIAILAGDSLFLDAFGFLAQVDLPDVILVSLIKELSQASGTFGMVAGQALDMAGEGQSLSLEQLQAIHANKTGKLLAFPFVAAGLIAEKNGQVLQHLRQIGQLVGLAFQVRDDILDVTATFEEIGKTPQKDLLVEKSTYPALLGLEPSKVFLEETLNQAVSELDKVANLVPFSTEKIKEMIESLRINA
ncbi:polyprenyl synthetase family protein [Streptococcus ruminantium]|uniref:Polyprenyl synthetase family protein n=2 Tax=Streptococcus ruminantium TaxID=1917441 RepID=A0ABU1B1Y3_9STRE|nr:farnesyl diphosphate synthase [Streptococcus ruminantium]MDQ8759533.1 polyprenyl synthetase family protein [Streptococcus ruminantium]MDQ8768458.1 polyprenyl synthetase family protein [Streptococcus ruminantium]MDQ8774332.1 polyprenyl synthetase family protein [Streptococcus ruminantium]MDQ8793242.1 polyprenyl synthetase family protein [Streptococcus ruminantium]MDQ8796161.1 polyprenyl synthetase family protein [Streptococcus ruminantium]